MAEEEVEMLRDVSQQSTDAVGSQDAKHEEGWVAVTDDNGVRKRTISTGSGETPQLHSICLGMLLLIGVAPTVRHCGRSIDSKSGCLPHGC